MKRSEALAMNATTYSTGKPCRRGHHSNRYASNGMCVQCLRDNAIGVTLAGRGLQVLTLTVHRDDAPAITAFAMKLDADRKTAARNALATMAMPEGFTLHPAFKAALVVGADVPHRCGACGHPGEPGVACELCGMVTGSI